MSKHLLQVPQTIRIRKARNLICNEICLSLKGLPKGKTHMDLEKGTLHENDAIIANCSGPQVSHLVPDIVWYLDANQVSVSC